MFGFRDLKKSAKDWVTDVKGTYERAMPVLNNIIPLLEEVVNLWEQNPTFRDYALKSNLIRNKFSSINNLELFLQEYKSQEYSNAKFLALKYNLIEEENEFESFLISLNEYSNLSSFIDNLRETIIKENYFLIYNNCRMISAYQKQNPELYKLIGSYQDMDSILGQNGEKIQSSDKDALNFITSLADFLNRLESQKIKIEIDYSSLKR